jgi:glycosyltransferase involved in cell wall biosynthesis
MRVLLYETGQSGHRGVYRNYYETGLCSAGVDVVVHSAPPSSGLFGFNTHLQQLAKDAQCDLLHLLTLDDHTKRIFFSAPFSPNAKRIPIVGTYYLFGNLRGGLKSSALRWCYLQGNLDSIAVPQAANLAFPDIQSRSGIPIYLLPDPVPAGEGSQLDRKSAFERFSLPPDWSDKTIVLVFGVLNKRRGVDFLTNAARALAETRNNLKFVFAGRLDRASLGSKTISLLRTLHSNGGAVLVDRWLEDAEVDMLYATSDVFCIHPERGFAGINSTAMRALDYGLAVVAPMDSVTSRSALAYGKGAAFRRGDVGGLMRVLQDVHESMIVPNRGKPRTQESRVTTDMEKFGHYAASFYRKILNR